MVGYIFPLLTVDEIIQVLKTSTRFPEVNVDVLIKPQNYVHSTILTEGGTTGPQGAGIIDIYIAFWEFLSGTHDVRLIPWHELFNEQNVQYPILYEEATRFLCIFRTLQHIHKLSGVDDFCFADLLKPDTKRLRRNLSALINFCRFKEDESTAETEHQKRVSEMDIRIVEVKDLARKLKSQVDQLEQQLSQESAACKLLEQEEKDLNTELESLNSWQIANQIEEKNREVDAITERLTVLNNEIQSLNDTNEGLEEAVISDVNPVELIGETNRLESAVSEKMARIAELEEMVRKAEEDIQKNENSVRRCSKYLQSAEEHEQLIEKTHALELSVHELTSTHDKQKSELIVVSKGTQEQQDKLYQLKSKTDQLLVSKSKEKQQSMSALAELDEKLRHAKDLVLEEQRKMSQNSEIHRLEQATAQINQKLDEKRNMWANMHGNLDASLKRYENEIRKYVPDLSCEENTPKQDGFSTMCSPLENYDTPEIMEI